MAKPISSASSSSSPSSVRWEEASSSVVRSSRRKATRQAGHHADHDDSRQAGHPQPVGPDGHQNDDRQHHHRDAAARVGQRERAHQHQQRPQPRDPPVAATLVGRQAQRRRHRQRAEQGQRVPVADRRAQARDLARVVEHGRHQLAAQRVGGHHRGQPGEGQCGLLGRAGEAGAEHHRQAGRERVAPGAVGLDPALVGRDRPRDREGAPGSEGGEQADPDPGLRAGTPVEPPARRERGQREDAEQREADLDVAAVGDLDRAVGEGRVGDRDEQARRPAPGRPGASARRGSRPPAGGRPGAVGVSRRRPSRTIVITRAPALPCRGCAVPSLR